MTLLTIQTDRLVLRDFQHADLSAYQELCSDPEFQRFYPELDAAPGETERRLSMFIAWADEQPRRRFQLAITRSSNELIGSCGVRITSEAERQGSFGCELGRPYWGMGYAYEAGRTMMEFGFRKLGLHRIWAETIAENEAAARLAGKLGMHLEGVLRDNRWFRGRWWSTKVLAVLESEWGV
jgi:RimJ/RimL family protein N-acetyltransferase